jgi:hypothetical protein
MKNLGIAAVADTQVAQLLAACEHHMLVNFATADYFTDLSLICIALLYFSIDFDN